MTDLFDKLRGIDEKIQALIVERARCIASNDEIINTEKKSNQLVLQENLLLHEVAQRNCDPLMQTDLMQVFRSINAACMSVQKPINIGFLGPNGTFIHAAAIKYFGNKVNFIAAKSIKEIFNSVEAKLTHCGVVPIEDSIGGIHNVTLDAFIDSTVNICGEIKLEINLHLLRNSEDKLPIKRIYSHEHPLLQCAKWLTQHYPGVEQIAVNSTAYAAELAKSEPGSAAIAGDLCADMLGLVKIHEKIGDIAHNVSRYLVVNHQIPEPTGTDKTSLIVTVSNIPGTLERLITPFSRHNINLTMIKSRPAQHQTGMFIFFLDVDAHQKDENFKNVMQELVHEQVLIKILGSYPRAVV